ncbi:hypothetical protein ACFYE2_03615 [Kocuria sp. CPCC 205300]|uniref:hypothetical protein n=1 Tax=Kocuria sabuli TaxID=3071448 RepID=UPI0036DB621E
MVKYEYTWRASTLWVGCDMQPLTQQRLAGAVVGGQDVPGSLHAVDLPRGVDKRVEPKYGHLVRGKLSQRYGPNFSWCSRTEIRLRCELLSALSNVRE